MSLEHNKYNDTIIYKLICNDENIKDCYVGHTTNFDMRKRVHKYNCTNINSKDYNVYIYKFIRNNGGWEKWEMQSIEHLQCNNKYEATIKEREYIDQT